MTIENISINDSFEVWREKANVVFTALGPVDTALAGIWDTNLATTLDVFKSDFDDLSSDVTTLTSNFNSHKHYQIYDSSLTNVALSFDASKNGTFTGSTLLWHIPSGGAFTPILDMRGYGGTPLIKGVRSNGTATTKSLVTSGTKLLDIQGHGYWNSSNIFNSSGIELVASQNWSSGGRGSRINFWNTPDASTTKTKRLTIEQNGAVLPGANNSQNFGSASLRWANIYSTYGTYYTGLIAGSVPDDTSSSAGFALDSGVVKIKWANRNLINDVVASMPVSPTDYQLITAQGVKEYADGNSVQSIAVTAPIEIDESNPLIPNISIDQDALRYLDWSTVDVNTNAVTKNGYLVDASSNAITITAPSTPSEGDIFSVVDYTGNANTNNITVARNGSNIMGFAEDLVLDRNNQAILLIYSDATQGWVITYAATDLVLEGQESIPTEFHYISGFELIHYDADPTYGITVSVGKTISEDGQYPLELTSPITKLYVNTGSWAPGDNQPGLFSGVSQTAGEVYNVFAIRKDSDGSIDVGFDTDPDCSNIPAGYTAYKWLGFFISLSTVASQIISFIHRNNIITFTNAGNMLLNSYGPVPESYTELDLTPWIPPVSRISHVQMGGRSNDTEDRFISFSYDGTYNHHTIQVSTSVSSPAGAYAWSSDGHNPFMPLNRSGSIYWGKGGLVVTGNYALALHAVKIIR